MNKNELHEVLSSGQTSLQLSKLLVPAGNTAVHLRECKCDALCLQELLITLEQQQCCRISKATEFLPESEAAVGRVGGVVVVVVVGVEGACREAEREKQRRIGGEAACST